MANETIPDIIAEMSGQAGDDGYPLDIKHYVRRLEAARKREVDALKQRCAELVAEIAAKDEVIKRLNDAISEEQRSKMATTEKSLVVGDCAKLREAMCEILSYIESFHKYITPGKGKKLTALFAVADTIRSKARAALAAPPRNCDVGTVEEQSERFYAYCKAHKDNNAECLYCPLFGQTGGHCELAWAQMPYEEGARSERVQAK